MSDLEEGEVVDSDCDGTADNQSSVIKVEDTRAASSIADISVGEFGSKATDQNAAFTSAAFPAPAAFSYTHHRSRAKSTSEDSLESSDEDTVLWNQKRAKYISKHQKHQGMDTNHEPATLPVFRNPLHCSNGFDKRNKQGNNIWSSVLEEQGLTQEMKSFDVENSVGKQLSDRNVESYDFTNAANDTRPFPDSEEDNMEGNADADSPFGGEVVDLEPDEGTSGLRPRKRKHVKLRLGERTFDRKKSRDHIGVTKEDSTEKIVAALVEHLREPKVRLLNRVVDILGKKKTLELLYLTEDIEGSGGMMTMDGSRRRTKGGVFIQLIKTDRHIEKKDVKEIFAEEEKEQKKILKALARKRRRQKRQQMAGITPSGDHAPNSKGSHQTDTGESKMDSSDAHDRDQTAPRDISRRAVCYESDDENSDLFPLNRNAGDDNLTNDGDQARGSGDGASDSDNSVGQTNQNTSSRVQEESFPEEDMLDIMPGEEETIE